MGSSPPPPLLPHWGLLDRAEAWLLAIPYTLTKNCPSSQPLCRQPPAFPLPLEWYLPGVDPGLALRSSLPKVPLLDCLLGGRVGSRDYAKILIKILS